MTPDEIKAARALIAAATPPPWGSSGDMVSTPSVEDFLKYLADKRVVEGRRIAICGNPAYFTPEQSAANAAFVAAARLGWPAALDEIERLRHVVECVTAAALNVREALDDLDSELRGEEA